MGWMVRAFVLIGSLFVGGVVLAHDGANDQLISGGGREESDCMSEFFGGELNEPADKPRFWHCYDGDPACDQGAFGDGKCEFAVGVCLNGTRHPECSPIDIGQVIVKNRPLGDLRYDAGFAALQSNIDALGLPTASENLCTPETAIIEVPLRSSGRPGKKKVRLKAYTTLNPFSNRVYKDSDKLKLMCEGCPATGTFDSAARFIFAGSCATSSCHTGVTPTGAMNLDVAEAYASLVNVVPDNPTAAAAGKKRVDPGNPANSFILDKLCGADPGDPALRPAVCAGHDIAAGEGTAMPPPTGVLSEAKIQLIYDWILAGAPATGWLPDPHCGVPLDVFEPIDPPPVPAGGIQLELPPFALAPGQEIEGCMWMQLPITQPIAVGEWETRMNQGSHHFILFRYISGALPTLNEWQPGNIACLTGSLLDFSSYQEPLTGAQDPIYHDAYPNGIARMIYPGDIVGLNAHYINTLNIPIEGHVYLNVHPYNGTLPYKPAEGIYAVEANASSSGIGVYGPGIAPFTIGYTTGTYVNYDWPGACVLQLTSHMHKRGTYFAAEYPLGNVVYSSTDWDHPEIENYAPPLWVPYNQSIRYTCVHDNGFTNPNTVRKNSEGVPTSLRFGFSADDEMCIMPGLSFTPSVAGNCTLP